MPIPRKGDVLSLAPCIDATVTWLNPAHHADNLMESNMIKSSLTRRDSLRGIVALGAAGAVAAVGAAALATGPADAAMQIHMDVALGTLNTGLRQLQDALADKGGYRDKAIGLVQQAIADVEAGIQYAKTH